MQTIHLHINGLTHRDIAERREEFLATAVGRSIVLRPAPVSVDARALEAYVGADCVGVVARVDVDLAWRALNAGKGESRSLRGRIVEAAPYELTMECEVEALADPQEEASDLSEWHYEGRVMQEWSCMRKMDYLAEEMEVELMKPEPDETFMTEMLEAFCQVAGFDISTEGMDRRKRLLQLLEQEGNSAQAEWRKAAASRLREMSRRMGGNTCMGELADWMRKELPASSEVQTVVLEPRRWEDVQTEARQLPHDLWQLYNHDSVQFIRVLYGAKPTRKTLLGVLSCLMWLDAHTAEPTDNISLGELARRVVTAPTEELRTNGMTTLNNLLSDDPRWPAFAKEIKQELLERGKSDEGASNTTFNNYGTYNDIQPGGTNITNNQDGNN